MSNTCRIVQDEHVKHLASPGYNYFFRFKDGFLVRWGATKEEDPDWSPFGPEIADIEISTICHKGCNFCYKSNGPHGEYMTLETFQNVFEKLPPSLTQIAFGIGDIDGNPDMWDIFRHCRRHGVVPNVTINGSRMNSSYCDLLVELCGAVSVSWYDDDTCFNAVSELSTRWLSQVNIHCLLSEETYEDAMELIDKAKSEPRLKGLNAIVFLAAKPVGRSKLTAMTNVEKYRALVDKAMKEGVSFGFDSCSAPLFLKAMMGHQDYPQYEMLAEPCESGLFSTYIDVSACQFPCSFLQHGGGVEGVSVLEADNFLTDVWNSEIAVEWRERLLSTCKGGLVNGCRQCPAFNLYGEDQ